MKRKSEDELSINAKRKRVQREKESPEKKKKRLEKTNQRNKAKRLNESMEEKKRRLIKRRESDKISRTISKKKRTKKNIKQSSKKKDIESRTKENKRKRKYRSNKTNSNLYLEAYNYNPEKDYSKDTKIGEMNNMCLYCKALKFPSEPAGMCCSKGKIKLPILEDPPNPLFNLVNGNSDESKHFNQNFLTYNNIFKMTSFGATRIVNREKFLPTFKIQGIFEYLSSA